MVSTGVFFTTNQTRSWLTTMSCNKLVDGKRPNGFCLTKPKQHCQHPGSVTCNRRLHSTDARLRLANARCGSPSKDNYRRNRL